MISYYKNTIVFIPTRIKTSLKAGCIWLSGTGRRGESFMFRGESKCNWLGSCEFEALVDPWNLSDTRKNDLKSCCGRSINGRSFNLHGGRDRNICMVDA